MFASNDPNPVVSANNTTAVLTEQGIDVVHFPLPEVDQFYQSYRHWTLTGKPWVTAKIAQSFDGMIAGPQGKRLTVSNALCAEFTHKHRLHCDIILTTARTINQDDPLLNARPEGQEHAKPVAIIDRQLTLNRHAAVYKSARHCIVYHTPGLVPEAHPNCTYFAMTDLNAVIDHLGSLGYHDVWVEAGGQLFGALHEEGLVNRTYVYLVPKVLGKHATPAWQASDIYARPHDLSWQAMGDNMIAQFDWHKEGYLPE